MTSTDSINPADILKMSFDELRAIDAGPQWQADIDSEERSERNRPAVTPHCPSWCRYEPGHEYDSVDFDEVTFIRYHSSERSGATATVQEEQNRSGEVTLLPPTISVYTDNDMQEITSAQARSLSGRLLEAADLLDQITAS